MSRLCRGFCVSSDNRNFVCRGWVLGMGAFHEILTGLCCHRNRCCFLLNHPGSSFYQISMRLPQIDPTVPMFVHSPLLMRFVQPLISSSSVLMKFPLVCCSSTYLYPARYKFVLHICNTGSSVIISNRYK